MITKEQLSHYRYLKKEIMLLQEEIERLRASLQSAAKLDGLPRSNYVVDRSANVVAKILDLEAQLHKNLRDIIELRGEIERCIEGLPADQRLLMRLRYIEGKRWEMIVVDMNYAWAQVHRIHVRALKSVVGNDDTK